MDIDEKREKVIDFIESGNYKMAELWTKNLLAQYPLDVNFHYLMAKALYHQKSNVAANEHLNFIRLHLYEQLNSEGKSLVEQLQALCLILLGKHKDASECFRRSSLFAEKLLDKATMYSNYLFMSNYFEDVTDLELSDRHKEYGNIFAGIQRYEYLKKEKKKIRIGYISPDFREHVVVYFSYALLAKYDKDRYEVFCYARCKEDAVSDQLKAFVDGWKNIDALTGEEAAALIYQDEIDILFDLSGHSAKNCLPVLSHKAAPVQLCGIGYFNTTGLPTVDYFLTDEYCDPVGQNDALFTEKLLRLSHSHFCYTPPDTALTFSCKKTARDGIVFGSFNNFFKITNEVLATWLKILERVPGSKLLLKSPHFHRKRELDDMYNRATKIGFLDAQLDIREASLPYLNEYADVDIALDTFPYPGGGTTCEALFMGCPLVTLKGRRHGARFGYSILENIGLGELAAESIGKYIEIAAGLAQDLELLQYLQENLRSIMQKSFLMNSENYVQEVEAAYERIWSNWLHA